jgi:hypothetical protein
MLLGNVLTVNSNAKWHGDVCGGKLWRWGRDGGGE